MKYFLLDSKKPKNNHNTTDRKSNTFCTTDTQSCTYTFCTTDTQSCTYTFCTTDTQSCTYTFGNTQTNPISTWFIICLNFNL